MAFLISGISTLVINKFFKVVAAILHINLVLYTYFELIIVLFRKQLNTKLRKQNFYCIILIFFL